MNAKFFTILAATALAFCISQAQTPAPIIVQAMPATEAPVAKVAPTTPVESNEAALKALAEIKAENEAALAKQAATLQQLDELQKAADQIRIFSKRG